jgi:hypothetical protein
VVILAEPDAVEPLASKPIVWVPALITDAVNAAVGLPFPTGTVDAVVESRPALSLTWRFTVKVPADAYACEMIGDDVWLTGVPSPKFQA